MKNDVLERQILLLATRNTVIMILLYALYDLFFHYESGGIIANIVALSMFSACNWLLYARYSSVVKRLIAIIFLIGNITGFFSQGGLASTTAVDFCGLILIFPVVFSGTERQIFMFVISLQIVAFGYIQVAYPHLIFNLRGEEHSFFSVLEVVMRIANLMHIVCKYRGAFDQEQYKLFKTSKKLKNAYEQVKLTTDALNEIAIIEKGDAEGRVTDVNHAFLKATGYKKSEVVGLMRNEFSNLLLSSDVHSPRLLDEMTDILRKRKPWKGEVCYRTKSGDPLWLLKNVTPMQEQGVYTGFFSFSHDITIRKKQEEEIIKAKKMAEDALAVKESFLSVMSHEIRTPLNSVIGLSNLLLRQNPRNDQKEIVMTLKNSGDNLMYLINNVLDYNKIRAGRIELEYHPFNLKEQLQLLELAHKPVALDKGLELQMTISSNTPVLLTGDSLRLNQILNNLLSNALKFTLKGAVKLSVFSRSSTDKYCQIVFVVEDTGIGIAEDKLQAIFTPFQQSENYIARRFGGSGLGLSIVKDLVKLLNGSITVTSKSNAGTIFTITLPFKLSQEVLTLDQSQEFHANEPEVLKGYRILYVEDVESNQMVVKSFLIDYDVECVIASNGEIALMHTVAKTFDVILMDLQMPDMSGYEVTKAIQCQENGKNTNTPIIAFTAEPYSEVLMNNIRKLGMSELLTKPFRLEQMIEKIQQVCPRKAVENIHSFTNNV